MGGPAWWAGPGLRGAGQVHGCGGGGGRGAVRAPTRSRPETAATSRCCATRTRWTSMGSCASGGPQARAGLLLLLLLLGLLAPGARGARGRGGAEKNSYRRTVNTFSQSVSSLFGEDNVRAAQKVGAGAAPAVTLPGGRAPGAQGRPGPSGLGGLRAGPGRARRAVSGPQRAGPGPGSGLGPPRARPALRAALWTWPRQRGGPRGAALTPPARAHSFSAFEWAPVSQAPPPRPAELPRPGQREGAARPHLPAAGPSSGPGFALELTGAWVPRGRPRGPRAGWDKCPI